MNTSAKTPNPLERRYITPVSVTDWQCRRILIPDDEQFRAAVGELLSRLGILEIWDEQPGHMTAQEAVWFANEMCTSLATGDCMLGTIIPHVRNTVPSWALPCDGSIYNRVDYPQLWSVLSPAFMLDSDTFKTPDLRGRVVMSDGDSDHPEFSTGGTYNHALLTSEMPSHEHLINPHAHGYSLTSNTVTAGGEIPGIASLGISLPSLTDATGYLTANAVGGDGQHTNEQPYFVVPYILVAR